ncbi:ABC transporter ATP-binding protein [Arthrobacter sp. H14]|uniref:ABC transporter ATP-binding protein n=1 Tax=Arthrobacter sp. H14 TaxID=1312959 RepID=UPI0004B34CE9|nr:ATP-binding cassette domain-containing protein [Arthrobacter sp. H14]
MSEDVAAAQKAAPTQVTPAIGPAGASAPSLASPSPSGPASSAPFRIAPPNALPISFKAVDRNFGTGDARRTVLRDINLDVHAGEIVAILGPRGCGKSTLLRATGGLDTAGTGTVSIGGTPVSAVDNRCAVASHEAQLSPEHTLQANVAMGLPIGTSAKNGKARVADLLKLLGLEQFAKHWPRDVPAGLAQRAALARALARNPGVLLLDEPFSTLDAKTRAKMQDLLLDIHRVARTTVLLVTDVVDEALQLADRIIVLGNPKDGNGDKGGDGSTSETANDDGTKPAADDGAGPGSSIVHMVDVPEERPRNSSSSAFVRVRDSLLNNLGIGNQSH